MYVYTVCLIQRSEQTNLLYVRSAAAYNRILRHVKDTVEHKFTSETRKTGVQSYHQTEVTHMPVRLVFSA